MKNKKAYPSRIWQVLRIVLPLFLLALPTSAAQAQDDDRAGAPTGLSAETTEDGIVLSWDAPVTTDDQITGYEVSGRHVRRGIGIVEELLGITDEQTTTWTDLAATDPELLYVYRVRPLFGEDAGRWSSFLITGLEEELQPTVGDGAEPEATAVPPGAPVEPTAALPEAEATPAGHVEPTQVAAAPPPQSGPTRVAPLAEPEPTSAPPEPEPTAAISLPEVEPTLAGPAAEPTASA